MKYFVSTGEISGDLHLSYIVNAAKKIDKTAEFYGVGGEYCKKAGVHIVQDINELSIMGFTEVIKKYSFLKKKAYEYLELIKKEKITRVILVDYGGFNLKFIKLLRAEIPNIEIYYYIPPKLWVWGKSRLKTLVMADHIMVIFPWEVDFYKENNVNVVYFGNPFIERYEIMSRTNEKILLLPGSRKGEIARLFPPMMDIIKSRPNEKFLLKLSSKDSFQWLKIKDNEYDNLEITYDKTLSQCVEMSKIAICASGTVTLELALLGLPAVVIYKTGLINEIIARLFLHIGFVSLPNITLNKQIYPELLQERCTAENIMKEIDEMLNDPIRKKEIENDIIEVRRVLKNNTEDIVDSYARYLLK